MHRQQLGLLVLVLQLSARGNEPWPDTQKRVRGVKGTGTSNSVSVMETAPPIEQEATVQFDF